MIDAPTTQLDPTNGDDSQQGQEAAALIAEAVAARRVGNRPLEEKIFHRLHELGVSLLFANDLEQAKTKEDLTMAASNKDVRMANNTKLLKRFTVKLLARELLGHKQVPLTVFHVTSLTNAEYARLLRPLDSNDKYLRIAVDETFTAREVKFLKWVLSELQPSWKLLVTPASPIAENALSATAICVDYPNGPVGRITWVMIDDSETPPVEGYSFGAQYDLRCAEAGPYVDGLDARSEVCGRGKGWYCD
jgi:hypothetical protein